MYWVKHILYAYILAVNRGSYMSAHVLLNSLNKLRKGDKINKFNNTRAQMLDSIYHIILRLRLL